MNCAILCATDWVTSWFLFLIQPSNSTAIIHILPLIEAVHDSHS